MPFGLVDQEVTRKCFRAISVKRLLRKCALQSRLRERAMDIFDMKDLAEVRNRRGEEPGRIKSGRKHVFLV